MERQHVNRREFTRRLAMGAVAAGTPFAASAAEDRSETKPQVTPPPPDEVLLTLQTIAARFPDERLTEPVLAAIGGDVQYNLLLSAQLSRFPLKTADEPAPIFAAWRAPSTKPEP